jgi:hypothetical protein
MPSVHACHREEPLGPPGFSDVSLPACHGLWTPADLHILAKSDASVLPSGTLKPSASAISLSRSCTSTSGSATSPTAYRILCLRLDHLVRRLLRLRHGPKARYGWVANPYEDASRPLLPTGTFTLKDTPSLSRRDNDSREWRATSCQKYWRTLPASTPRACWTKPLRGRKKRNSCINLPACPIPGSMAKEIIMKSSEQTRFDTFY